jgi:hypothetical protein
MFEPLTLDAKATSGPHEPVLGVCGMPQNASLSPDHGLPHSGTRAGPMVTQATPKPETHDIAEAAMACGQQTYDLTQACAEAKMGTASMDLSSIRSLDMQCDLDDLLYDDESSHFMPILDDLLS